MEVTQEFIYRHGLHTGSYKFTALYLKCECYY